MPGPPPMNSAAATMLVAKKAIATGMPSIISPTPRPNRSSAAQYHCIQGLLRLPAEAAEEILAPHDEAQELDAHHRERQRDEGHRVPALRDRKSTRLNSSHVAISYAVFCLKKKKKH